VYNYINSIDKDLCKRKYVSNQM